ncbi:bilirubin oxidase [Streptomyces spongiicola]|uniref:Multicopper oxidase CueO n=1 Tax=Streptomyces spongiicola TaxID=1690221 RepID=A0A2S1Z3Q4_9ACTN|nr:multicopper oxidase family protein [Streptomyces spongiicola]AWK10985.1 bilirubin oxidase [Streptomyces spongiicola]GBQ03562.1 bilirubin oxidase [Streptomyces spongiicola]
MLKRRVLLGAGGVVATGAALAWPVRVASRPAATAAADAHAHPASEHILRMGRAAMASPRQAAQPFTVRMPVPRVATPVRRTADTDVYTLALRPAQVEILPGTTTAALTYGGTFVGPTIKARTGRKVQVTYVNALDKPANVHLHGGHVPPESDGYPMDLIAVGASRTFDYPNRQAGSTLWYHDHTHHMEAEHVYRGMHGFYLVEGPQERRLGLPRGRHDVPIMLRDAHFDATGGLILDVEHPEARSTLLANGRPLPYFPVDAAGYRLRLLNSSIHRIFRLDLGGVEMVQIASDGGLLPEPVPRTTLTLAPAERAEIVVDFGRHAIGSKLVLSDAKGPVMRFDVTRRVPDTSRVPSTLRTLPPLPASPTTRRMKLGVAPSKTAYAINDLTWDADRVDARITEGTSEIWEIYNADTVDSEFGGIDHTFHLHLVQFRVLDRDGGPPLPGESGFKDTVLVRPGERMRIQATFTGWPGRYVYHCHMQEHNVAGMMAQLEIVR